MAERAREMAVRREGERQVRCGGAPCGRTHVRSLVHPVTCCRSSCSRSAPATAIGSMERDDFAYVAAAETASAAEAAHQHARHMGKSVCRPWPRSCLMRPSGTTATP
jgi:hypothetical protein